MKRMIAYDESELEVVQSLIETSDADIGSIYNNMENQEHVIKMLQSIDANLRLIKKKLFGE